MNVFSSIFFWLITQYIQDIRIREERRRQKNFYFCYAQLAGDKLNSDQATALSRDGAAEETANALSPPGAQSKDRETPVKKNQNNRQNASSTQSSDQMSYVM